MSKRDRNDIIIPAHELPSGQGPQGPTGRWPSGEGEIYDAQVVEETGGGFSLRPILYVVFRHLGLIAFAFLAVAGAMALYVAHIPDSFDSQARVMIRGERLGVIFDPLAEGSSMHKTEDYNSTFGTEFGILASHQLAAEVVDRLGPDYLLAKAGMEPAGTAAADNPAASSAQPSLVEKIKGMIRPVKQTVFSALRLDTQNITQREEAIGKLMKNLKADVSNNNSQILLIEYTDTDPARAQKVLSTLVDVYATQHIEFFKNQIEPEFFKKKSDAWKIKIQNKEKELATLQKSLNITSLDNEKELLATQLNGLQTRMVDFDVQMSANTAREGALRQLLAQQKETLEKDDPVAAPSNTGDDRMRDQLVALKLQEVDLAGRFLDADPRLQSVRDQIAYLENLMAGRDDGKGGVLSKSLNPAYQDIKLQLQTLNIDQASILASKNHLQTELDKTQKTMAVLTSNEAKILELQREKNLLEEEYIQYAKSEQVAEISQTLDKDHVSNLRVIQAASLPFASARLPRKMMALLGLGCFLGLFMGGALAFLLEFLDQSCKTREDTEEKLGLPVLASIPASRQFVKRIKESMA